MEYDPELVTAVENGDLESVVDLLTAGAVVEARDRHGWTPLRAAVASGRDDAVRLLLDYGADPGAADHESSILATAIETTRHHPSPEAVRTVGLLLAAGAQVSPDEDPAVAVAVSFGAPPSVVRLLVAHGADPRAERSDGTPVLVLAAMHGDAALVDTLLAAGAAVDAVDAAGRTALMHAVERGVDDVVAVLLCAGADASVAADDGSTALDLANAWGRQRIQARLGERAIGWARVDVPRTVVSQQARTIELVGDRDRLERLAVMVAHAIDDLGDDEFRTIVGAPAAAGRAVVDRLCGAAMVWPDVALRRVEITRDEQALIRGALLALTSATSTLPAGMTRIEVGDAFDEVNRAIEQDPIW